MWQEEMAKLGFAAPYPLLDQISSLSDGQRDILLTIHAP
jgi:hypothetical protein